MSVVLGPPLTLKQPSKALAETKVTARALGRFREIVREGGGFIGRTFR